MSAKKQLPNIITLGNLTCGVLAVIQLFEGTLATAFFLIGLAMVLDFFDGFVARLLGVSGPLGKELDSLADVVSFGVFPGLLLWKSSGMLIDIDNIWGYAGLLIAPFSAYRLAKFNIDTRPGETFYGLPTPANTLWIMTICGAALLVPGQGFWYQALSQIWVVPILAGISCILMISDIPLLSLKFKTFGFRENRIRFILILASIVLVVFWGFGGAAFIIPLYLVLSIISRYFLKYEIQSGN
jgi:CDP-diacylglycerol---serine O-phosphatidyltransferase